MDDSAVAAPTVEPREASAPPETVIDRKFADAQRHFEAGRLDQVRALCHDVLSTVPEHAGALNLLGVVACQRREFDVGTNWFRQVISMLPNSAEAHFNLGNALREQGRFSDALAPYRQALAIDPAHTAAGTGLGMALAALGMLEEAVASLEQALISNPGFALAHNSLANTLKSQGRISEAVMHFRRAAELQPRQPSIHSNLLLCLQYDASTTPASLLVEHRAYAAQLPPGAPQVHTNLRDPNKRLKIGYVSPDLHRHPVGFMLVPVLTMHDRANVAIHCYYNDRREDTVTASLKSHAEVWRSTAGVGDEALAAMITADGIDILVDLTGHTPNNRLPVFALKPAPVQATWAGYVGTTGLSAIDYLITDRWHSPPGAERYAVEKLVRLPEGYVCWPAPSGGPEVCPLVATVPGAVTFGCFNNLAKINPLVMALWGRLLRELPASQLVLKTHGLEDVAVRERIMGLFTAEGISTTRITLDGPSPHAELLRRYNDIDIALDPFPYSGGLTTIEALWMGIPVVTMPGERFASRHSLSHLSNAGLGELVADGPEAYLRIARELANDLPRLAALRAGMRDRLYRSPLLRAERFTRGLERAFRMMWQRWCGQTA